MSEPGQGAPPYQVVYSTRCTAEYGDLLERAKAKGRFDELAQAGRDVDTRLKWIPLDFGDPLRDFAELGLQGRIAVASPLVVRFAVDEARRIVYVIVPFKVLPNSGLEAPPG